MPEAQEANNVVRGPWISREPNPDIGMQIITTHDGREIATSGIALIKHNHIAETLLTIVPILFNNIDLAGFHMEQDDAVVDATLKDGQLIVEAIKSLLCKHYDIYHPLQDVAEAMFIHADDGSVSIAERLDIDFEPMEPMIAILTEDYPESLEE